VAGAAPGLAEVLNDAQRCWDFFCVKMNNFLSGQPLKQILLTGLMILGGIVIGLLLVEIGLRIIPQEQVDSIVERTSQRLTLYQLDKRIGWTLRPNAQTVMTTRDERVIPIQINSLGLRDTEHTYQKPSGTFRMLLLGDSFTEALHVHLEESYAYRVEQCLSGRLQTPVEVINAGVSGYSLPEEYLFYKYEGINYQPDLVVLMLYVGNDFTDFNRTTRTRLVSGFGGYRFELNGDTLTQNWVSWDTPYSERVSAIELFLRRYSRLWRVLTHPESKIYSIYRTTLSSLNSEVATSPVNNKLDWKYYLHTADFLESSETPPQLDESWMLFKVFLKKLQHDVQADGRQLAVVIIPADYQVSHWAREQLIKKRLIPVDDAEVTKLNWNPAEPNRTIVELLKQQQIPVLDLLPNFTAHDEAGGASLYFKSLGAHLNRDGHRLTAQIMCDWFNNNQAVTLAED